MSDAAAQLDYAPVASFRRRRQNWLGVALMCAANVAVGLGLAWVFRNTGEISRRFGSGAGGSGLFWWLGTIVLIPSGVGFALFGLRAVWLGLRDPHGDSDEVRVEDGRLVLRRGGEERAIDLAEVRAVELSRFVLKQGRQRGDSHTTYSRSCWIRPSNGRTIGLDSLPVGRLRRFHAALQREAPHVAARTRHIVSDKRHSPPTVSRTTWRGFDFWWLRRLRHRLRRRGR